MRGETNNILAAFISFLFAGVGQICQGRILMGVIQLISAIILWFFLMGWIIHIWSCIDAALFKGFPEQIKNK